MVLLLASQNPFVGFKYSQGASFGSLDIVLLFLLDAISDELVPCLTTPAQHKLSLFG